MNRAASLRRGGAVMPHLALVAVQLMFGTWPVVGKIALRTLPSTGLVAFRVGGAAVAFLILQSVARRAPVTRKRDYGWLALCSLLGVVLNQFLFVKGLSLTTVINATLLGTTIPVFTLIVSISLGHDQISLRKALGVALAASGVIYLVDPARADFSGRTTLGDLLILANSLSYGVYIAISKDLLERYGALTVITWIFALGCVVTLPVGAFTLAGAHTPGAGAEAWLAVLYIILAPTVGAYYLNAWALRRVAPGTVATYIYLQPLIAFALAPLILDERWNSRTWIASALIFAGVFTATRRGRGRAVEGVAAHPDALGH